MKLLAGTNINRVKAKEVNPIGNIAKNMKLGQIHSLALESEVPTNAKTSGLPGVSIQLQNDKLQALKSFGSFN